VENSDLVTIIIAIIGTLGGTSAWNFYQRKLELNRETEKDREKQTYLYRDDLRERVAVLESKLDEERQERLLLLTRMQEQSEELAALRTEVKYLREERERLMAKIDELIEKQE
jgi:uncharacterized membrane protein YgaE (UPF0421/DUF939 family)